MQTVLYICVVLALLSLSGCGTYGSYIHLDPTPLQGGNDAYDLACWGKALGKKVTLDGAVCKDLRGGGLLKIEARYNL